MKTPFPVFDEELVLEIERHLDQDYATEPFESFEADQDVNGDMHGLIITRYNGRSKAERGAGGAFRGTYVRPVFQIFDLEASSSMRNPVHPCPDCDNWAYTVKCPEHPERGVEKVQLKQGPASVIQRLLDTYAEMARNAPFIPATPRPPEAACDNPECWVCSGPRANIHGDPPPLSRADLSGLYMSSDESRQRAQDIMSAYSQNPQRFGASPETVAQLRTGQIDLTGYTWNPPENNRVTYTIDVEADTGTGRSVFQLEIEGDRRD